MNTRTLGIIVIGLMGASCITEGNYGTKLGATFCERYEECEPDEFEMEYDSLAACKDEARELFGDTDSDYSDCLNDAGCKFDGAAARACRKSIDDATCDDDLGSAILGDCAQIYDCGDADAAAVTACFTS